MLPIQKDQDDAVRRIARIFNNEWTVWQPQFDAYEKGYNYLMGDQYSPEEKAWYQSQRRPVNVWNIVFPVFNRILGDFLLNQQKIRTYAKAGGTARQASLLEQVIETININTEFKDEMAATILAGLVKRGYIHGRYSNEHNLDGSIVITNTDEFELMFDSRSIDYFADDGMYMIRFKWATVSQILARWSQHRKALEKIMIDKEASDFWEATDEFDMAMLSHKNFADEKNGRYRIIEFHHRVWKPAEIAYNPETDDSEVLTLEGKKRELFIKSNPGYEIVETDNAEMIQIDEVIPGLSFFLDRKDADIQDRHFDYIPYTPYPYGKKSIKHFGVFANAIGPQNEFNDLRNQMLNIINKAASNAVAVKPQSIRNWIQMKNHGHEPGFFIEVKEGANIQDVYKRYDSAKNPLAEKDLAETAYNLLHKIIGITENLRGETQTKGESGSLFFQRVREAQKAFVPVDRAQKRTTTRLFNRVIKLFQKHYSQERTFTILNPWKGSSQDIILNMQVGLQIMNDVRTGEYYVFPTNEEINSTLRAMKFLQKTEIVKLTNEMVGPSGINFRWWLENADFEDIEAFIQSIEQAQQMAMQSQGSEAQAGQMSQMMQLAQQRLAIEGQAGANNPEVQTPGGGEKTQVGARQQKAAQK